MSSSDRSSNNTHYPEIVRTSSPSRYQNQISIMDDENRVYRVKKEYYKNNNERYRKYAIEDTQNELSSCSIRSLDTFIFTDYHSYNLPESLVNTARCLSIQTELDLYGNCIMLLGTMSIATWGRLGAQLTPHWFEPQIDMLLHVSPSGTRKSALVTTLRFPYDVFCTEANKDHKKNALRLKVEAQQMNKAADKLVSKQVDALVKNMYGISNANFQYNKDIEGFRNSINQATALKLDITKDANDAIKPPVQLLIDDATPYKLGISMSEQGECQGCITAEGSMLGSKLLNSSGVTGLFLRSHTQEPYVYENARKTISLSHPALPMINIVQDTVAVKFYNNDMHNEIGVSARFVPHFRSKHCTIIKEQISDDAFTFYNNKISQLLKLYHTQDKNAIRYKISVESRALRLINDFKDSIKYYIIPDMPKEAEPCLRKAHGQAVRFALDIHAWNHDQPHTTSITEQEMEQGISIVENSFEHIRYAYDPCGLIAFKTAQKIVQSLMRINVRHERNCILNKGTDSSTIQRRIDVKSKEVNNALILLDRHNVLAVYDDATNNLKVVLHRDFFNFFRE